MEMSPTNPVHEIFFISRYSFSRAIKNFVSPKNQPKKLDFVAPNFQMQESNSFVVILSSYMLVLAHLPSLSWIGS